MDSKVGFDTSEITVLKNEFVKINKGRKLLYLIPVLTKDESIMYLDFSALAKQANTKDKQKEHLVDSGPNFGIELKKALDYAEYLKTCNIHEKNMYQYGTKTGYTIEYTQEGASV